MMMKEGWGEEGKKTKECAISNTVFLLIAGRSCGP